MKKRGEQICPPLEYAKLYVLFFVHQHASYAEAVATGYRVGLLQFLANVGNHGSC